jgi:hypothetical protein
MANNLLRPMCFIAMPFGKRPPLGRRKPLVDFDRIHSYIAKGAEAAGLEPIRADYEPAGGFIHKPMLERLLVAEYVIADLTLSNPNVLYEVGVRHGASARATLLICADKFVGGLVFDVRPLRVLPYGLEKDGSIAELEGQKLADSLQKQLTLARTNQLPIDNPIMQVTSWKPAGSIEHSKTDVFLQRLKFTGQLGERIKAAVTLSDRVEAVNQLIAIEQEVVNLPSDVVQIHTALLGVFLGYREKKAYDRMADLFEKFPGELKQTPVAREQYALALNRLAELAAKEAQDQRAEDLRRRALHALDAISEEGITSETYGIRGRIYKGWHDALSGSTDGNAEARAAAMLQKAIETYEQGLRADLRDYYPGVNAVTLRLLRGTQEDHDALQRLVPVVRYSVSVAPVPKNDEERYWQTATKLELATADHDWAGARRHVNELLAVAAQSWMVETTRDNLTRQQTAFMADPVVGKELQQIIHALSGTAQ